MKEMSAKYPEANINYDKYNNVYKAQLRDKNNKPYALVTARSLSELETRIKEQKYKGLTPQMAQIAENIDNTNIKFSRFGRTQ